MRVATVAVLPPRPRPRPHRAVVPVSGAAPRERRDPGAQGRRQPIVVHVPIPLGPCGAASAVRDAYRVEMPPHAVDLYL